MDGRMGGGMDGWMGGWVDGWVDGWMDGWQSPFLKAIEFPYFASSVKMITDLAVTVGCMGASKTYAHIPLVLSCRYMAPCMLFLSLGMSKLAPCILTR